jgi:hypothetical protein
MNDTKQDAVREGSVQGQSDRVVVKDAENLSPLGGIMKSLLSGNLKNPRKVALLETMRLSVAIKPTENPEGAITITFSDGIITLEPGVSPKSRVRLFCDLQTLLQLPTIPMGPKAIKYFLTPEGKAVAMKFITRKARIKGAVLNAFQLIKFTKFLTPSAR